MPKSRISNNSYTLLRNLYTPLFRKRLLIFVFQFIRTRKNEIIILLFVQLKCKHGEMAFLTSISASNFFFFFSYSQERREGKINQGSDLVL